MQIRTASWVVAGIFLLAFCWLGSAADKFALLFEGMGVTMPTMTRLVSEYGPVACPLLGVVAAISLVLTDRLRSGLGRWIQPILITIYALLVVNIFYHIMSPTCIMVTSVALKA